MRFTLNNTQPTHAPSTLSFEKFVHDHPVVEKNKGRVLLTTQPPNPIKPALGNGFMGSLWLAYSHHHELVLRPDDVWLAICAAFANYVDSHAEEMRSEFVVHEGKVELIATGGGNITTTDWPDLIKQLTVGMEKYVKTDVVQWMQPTFSTTTDKDILIGRSMLMGAMKNYFEYSCYLECGIPAVTLLGTLEDWKLLCFKTEKLADFGKRYPDLGLWYNLLAPVVNQFVEAFEGRVDTDFWNRICHQSGGGSGPSYISGWSLVFTPFKKGKFFLNKDPTTTSLKAKGYGRCETGKVPASTVEVPVYVNDNGREYNTMLYVGAIVSSYDKASNQIAPSYDWCLVDVTK